MVNGHFLYSFSSQSGVYEQLGGVKLGRSRPILNDRAALQFQKLSLKTMKFMASFLNSLHFQEN